jgi:hypothetical protein
MILISMSVCAGLLVVVIAASMFQIAVATVGDLAGLGTPR